MFYCLDISFSPLNLDCQLWEERSRLARGCLSNLTSTSFSALACEPFDWLIGGVFFWLCTLVRALICEPLIGLLGLCYLVYAFE